MLAAPVRLPAQAMPVVRGTVVSEDDQPVAQAIIELRIRSNSTPVRIGQSGPAGRFEIDSVAPGVYHLLIRSIGFGPATTPDFTVAPGQARDLGRINLRMTVVQLEPIEVVVERPDVVVEPDRTGYLVEALTNATGGVVTDILREIPEVMVDLDGTIRFRGAVPSIFLNGRPAPMQGVSLAVFLEQFPADRIDRVEVLEHPPARYSTEGSGSIINIVLRQGAELGLTGSVSLSGGTRNQYNASGRATLQRGGLIVNGGFNTRWSDTRNADFTLRQNLLATPVTYLQQDSRSDRSSATGGFSLDLRYNLSRRTRMGARLNGNLNGSDRSGFTETTHLDESRLPTTAYRRLSRQEGDGNSMDARFEFGHAWIPDRHQVEMEVWFQRNRSGNRIREEIAPDSLSSQSELLPPWLTLREDGNRGDVAAFELNYQRPWARGGSVSLGTSLRRNETSDDQSTWLYREEGSEVPDEIEARLAARVHRVGSAYLTLQRQLGRFGLVAGLRGELVGERLVLPDTVLSRDHASVFPTLNLSWNPRPRMSVRLGYSQRKNWPGISLLDPTNRSTDPVNRLTGNPDLRSSLTRSVTLGFNWGGRLGQFSIGPYWNRTIDGWERVTRVDPEGISTTTWANLASRTTLGASLSYGLPAMRGWNSRVNLSASRSNLTGVLVSPGLDDGQVLWSVSANVSGPVFRGLLAQGSFGYEPGRELPQGRVSGQGRADFSFRYRIMNNRTLIGISVQDPLELRRTTQRLRDPSVIQTGSSRVSSRSVSLSVSYTFGGGRGRPGDR